MRTSRLTILSDAKNKIDHIFFPPRKCQFSGSRIYSRLKTCNLNERLIVDHTQQKEIAELKTAVERKEGRKKISLSIKRLWSDLPVRERYRRAQVRNWKHNRKKYLLSFRNRNRDRNRDRNRKTR